MHKTSNLLWGLLLVIIGIIFGINALGIANINVFFNGWWTLFIIIPCFIDLFKDKKEKIGNIIGLIIGLTLLLGSQGIINFELLSKLLIPVILVIIGLSIIFKDTINGKVKKEIKKINKNNLKEYCATFGSQEVDYTNEEFKGCSLSAVFGEIKCDLNKAKIDKDCVIEVSAIFGGVTIYVPQTLNVKISSIPLFGGVSDQRKDKSNDNDVTIYIKATSMFGGVDIK